MVARKNKTAIKSVIAVLAFALIAAIAFAFAPKAYAEDSQVVAFIDCGATKVAQDTDKALGLTEGGVTVNGTATEGDTLFDSYVTNGSGSITLADGEYRVSLAIIKEAATSVTVDGNAIDLSGVENGKAVVTANVTGGGEVEFAVTGKLCAVMATAPEDEVLMAAEVSEGQVVTYGKLITEELDNATGYYSSGEVKDAEIEYGNISADTGINENFNTVNVSGVIKGTALTVNRYVIIMPEDLVYFVNAGSSKVDNKYGEGDGADPYYDYNKTVFEHFDLINQPVSGNAEYDMGRYKYTNTDSVCSSTKSEFPYSSIVWNEKGKNELGYKLNGFTSGEKYRVFIGSVSKWHPRTVQIRFNGEVVGVPTLYIGASKSFTVYEDVPASGSGEVDILMTGASTNEPTIAFIAVQKMSTEYAAVPTAPTAASIIGMSDKQVTITGGIQAGAKLQFYTTARPYNLIHEEIVDGEKINGNGRYTVDFGFSSETVGSPLNGVAQFNIVQITSGGVSASHTVSITDIRNFAVTLSPDGYTTGSVTVNVTATAPSGIASWSYRKGEYGATNVYNLNLPYKLDANFTVTENDNYYIVVTSGLGVTYSEIVTVDNISGDRPVIEIIPSSKGWGKGSYNVSLEVSSIAPIVEYALYRNGVQLASSATAPDSISFATEGEYVISVTNEAGVTSVRTVNISAKPTVATIKSRYANRTLTYRFLDNDDFKIASVSAYKVTKSSISKVTISNSSRGTEMDVYNAGKYVVTVTATDGTVEMFAIEAQSEDFAAKKDISTEIGVGLGVGIGGLVIALVVIVLVVVLLKKKTKKA